ncbi:MULTISPECIES: hypothetical protein [unclassified Nonomuraea]|uniref:hypothetical protein n=1 Tax=unclassified Nonomuraea TaxID=2593643 RepID=UPI00137867E9|nr:MULTISPECIES: hypothetical protein [unclassified Nonomuraea]NBE94609.1 hypothetical protein [Nonomuraea sp. K271]
MTTKVIVGMGRGEFSVIVGMAEALATTGVDGIGDPLGLMVPCATTLLLGVMSAGAGR